MGKETGVELDGLQHILDKVKLIRFKYENVLKADQSSFNIFSLLLKENDEVRLHSRFISELLDPAGCHLKGDEFLKAFLNIHSVEGFDLSSAWVATEYEQIDILIANDKKQAIIIENKINAGDQDKQLERYIKTLNGQGFKNTKEINNVWVIYLSLDGRDPSVGSLSTENKKALEKINRFLTCSYRDDVTSWLGDCIHLSATFPTLRETLCQYQELVKKLTGQSLTRGHVMENANLLMTSENFTAALDIEEALLEAKIELQWSYWESLQMGLLQKGLTPKKEIQKKDVEKFYKAAKNRNDYRLEFPLSGDDVLLVAELDDEYIVTFGFFNGYKLKKRQKEFEEFFNNNIRAKICKQSMGRESYNHGQWVWYCENISRLNFHFLTEKEARLFDKINFDEIIEQDLQEIYSLAKCAKKELLKFV